MAALNKRETNKNKGGRPAAGQASQRHKKKRNPPILLTVLSVGIVGAASVALFFLLAFGGNQEEREQGQQSAAVISQESQPEATSSMLSASTAAVPQLGDPLLVLVNKYNKMPDTFSSDLVELKEVTLDSRAKEAYENMYNAASENGISLWISSAYRSPALQDKLFQQEIEQYVSSGMPQEQALSTAAEAVAKGGYSEHNTGLAIDVNGVKEDFDGTKAGQWMQEHAQEYGFILRYPKGKQALTGYMYEPWHYRYVGKENALAMKNLGFCLEEYVDYLHQTAQNQQDKKT